MKYVLYREGGQYRWRLVAANGKKIANGGEAYHNRDDCIAAVTLVMDTNRQTPFTEERQ